MLNRVISWPDWHLSVFCMYINMPQHVSHVCMQETEALSIHCRPEARTWYRGCCDSAERHVLSPGTFFLVVLCLEVLHWRNGFWHHVHQLSALH